MSSLLGLLPAGAILVAIGVILIRRPGRAVREAVLEAAVLVAVWLVVGTELLSWGDVLGPGVLHAWWTIPVVTGAAILVRQRARWRSPRPFSAVVPGWEWLVIAPVVALAAVALLSALAPPNNYDSLSYHLPRIVLWLQHGSVDHYSTNNVRQLMMPPFAEYAGAHLMGLTRSERLLGLTQWCAAIVTLVATSLVTRHLGGGRVVQWLACLIVLACPIVFMQASNTKNDLVVGMWLTISAWWALRWWDEPPTLRSAALLGAALGLCALTKGTGVLFTVPVAIAAGVAAARRSLRRGVAAIGLAAVVALALNAPFLARNVRQFRRPFGPAGTAEGGYDLVNERHDLRALASNALRSVAQEAALPSHRYDALLSRAVTIFHERVLDLPVNDASTTTPYSRFDEVRFWPGHEDLAAAPVHALLAAMLPLALAVWHRRLDVRKLLLVLGMVGGAFALLCLVLKWQEWNVRFLASLTGLLAPPLAVALTARRRTALVVVTALALCVGVLPTVRRNPRPVFSSRGVLGGDGEGRFAHIGGMAVAASLADLAAARGAAVVGLATVDNDPDYLYVRAIEDRLPWRPEFEYVNPNVVVPGSRHLGPDLVIAPPKVDSLTDGVTGRRYHLERAYPRFSVLVPERPESPARSALRRPEPEATRGTGAP